MKFYTLEAVVRGENVKFDKTFASRDSAIDYMFKYYKKHYMDDVEVDEQLLVDGNKHNIEYVCNQHDRFRINRVVVNL